MKPNKVFSMIGLATKAGKTVSGEFVTEKAIKTGKAFLVIVAGDASDNTKKMFTNTCDFYQIPMAIYGTKDELAGCMGKEVRASMAVLDEGFGKQIMKNIDIQNNIDVHDNMEV